MSYYQNVIKKDSVLLDIKRAQWREWYSRNKYAKQEANRKYRDSVKKAKQQETLPEFEVKHSFILCL